MGVGGAYVRLDQLALEGETVVAARQGDAFEVAQLAAQALQLAVGSQLELQYLANMQTTEAFGFLAAANGFV